VFTDALCSKFGETGIEEEVEEEEYCSVGRYDNSKKERIGRRKLWLNRSTIPAYACRTEESYGKPKKRQPISRPRFERTAPEYKSEALLSATLTVVLSYTEAAKFKFGTCVETLGSCR
jgi:hypothetical protein